MTTGTDVKSVYERLRLHYNRQGSAAVRKIVLQILELKFTPEEAELALMMPQRDATNIAQLVEKSGLEESKVRSMVDSMTAKGIIQWVRNPQNTTWVKDPEKEDSFRFFDFDYSLYTPMVGDGTTSDMKRKVTEQREKLNQMGFSSAPLGPEQAARLYTERWLPAEEFVDPSEELAPWERFSHYAEQAKLITAVACGCRATTNRCNRSVFSCFQFDEYAYHWVNYRGMPVLTKEELIQRQKEGLREGLVCQAGNVQELPPVICSCCRECCGFLRPYNEDNHPGLFVKSNFLPQWDMEKCRQCFTCKSTCPVGAIFRLFSHKDEERDRPEVMEHRCIGCGVCAASCPRQAISLKRVRNEVPIETWKELAAMWRQA